MRLCKRHTLALTPRSELGCFKDGIGRHGAWRGEVLNATRFGPRKWRSGQIGPASCVKDPNPMFLVRRQETLKSVKLVRCSVFSSEKIKLASSPFQSVAMVDVLVAKVRNQGITGEGKRLEALWFVCTVQVRNVRSRRSTSLSPFNSQSPYRPQPIPSIFTPLTLRVRWLRIMSTWLVNSSR